MTTESRSTLSISVRHLRAVERHAAVVYPEECCGVLVGRLDGNGVSGERSDVASSGWSLPARVRVHRVLPARNEEPEQATSRFTIAPETVLAARREASRLGLDVVGYYHSHPDRPAEPSPTDLEGAWAGMSYLIVSVESGKAVETRSWRLGGEGERFEEEAVEPVGEAVVLAGAEVGPDSGSPSDGGAL